MEHTACVTLLLKLIVSGTPSYFSYYNTYHLISGGKLLMQQHTNRFEWLCWLHVYCYNLSLSPIETVFLYRVDFPAFLVSCLSEALLFPISRCACLTVCMSVRLYAKAFLVLLYSGCLQLLSSSCFLAAVDIGRFCRYRLSVAFLFACLLGCVSSALLCGLTLFDAFARLPVLLTNALSWM